VVFRVDAGLAVGEEAVAVYFRREGRGGVCPDAGRIFGHGDGLGDTFEVELDLLVGGIFEAEGDGAVGMEFVGEELRRGGLGGLLSGKGERGVFFSGVGGGGWGLFGGGGAGGGGGGGGLLSGKGEREEKQGGEEGL